MKQQIVFYLKLIVSLSLIVWGCEFLTGLVNQPDLLRNWLGPVMIISGTAIAGFTCYKNQKGAPFVGLVLLFFVGVYAWNLSYWYDPTRVSGGTGPPADFLVAPALLLLLGVFFSVFFRYLYPKEKPVTAKESKESVSSTEPPTPKEPNTLEFQSTSWYRLLLLLFAVGLAIGAGYLSGVEESVQRTQIILTVLVLGSVATGLITEKTLIKIISSWKK
jgi:hypothetical protein